MTRPSTRLRLAALAALTLLFAGCGEDPEPQMPPSSEPSPSTTTTPSPTSDAAVEPTLPPEAEGNDEAAAEAFVRYYYDVVNYAQVSGDLEALRSASLASCSFCTNGAEYVQALYEKGGRQVGGGYSISDLRVTLATKGAGIRTFDALVSTASDPYTVQKTSSASPEEFDSDTQKWTLLVTWDKSGFSVGEMDVE